MVRYKYADRLTLSSVGLSALYFCRVTTIIKSQSIMKNSIVRINRNLSVSQSSITRLESDSNYTILHFKDRSKEIVATSLYKVHERFNPKIFVRINRSMVINLSHLRQLPSEPLLKIDLVDAKSLRVSRRRKKELQEAFFIKRNSKHLVRHTKFTFCPNFIPICPINEQ
jgi:two-component system, LytTR family, response regulator